MVASGLTLAVSSFRLRARLGFPIPSTSPASEATDPAFGYDTPHPSVGGTLTLLNYALLSTHHSSIGDSWPIAFSGYPRGPRVPCETECPRHAAPSLATETRSRTRVSREPDGHRRRNLQRWSGFDPRHSSCLWFQMLGVEARSSLPHDQHDGGNLPGQG